MKFERISDGRKGMERFRILAKMTPYYVPWWNVFLFSLANVYRNDGIHFFPIPTKRIIYFIRCMNG